MLKTFLQSFRMQFIFRSFEYERQKQIVDLLIFGVNGGLFGIFEPAVTLNIPYSISGLSILLKNYQKLTNYGQAQKICTELMKSLTQDHLYTFFYCDGETARDVIEKHDSGQLVHQNPETQDVMEKLLSRLRKVSDNFAKSLDAQFLRF